MARKTLEYNLVAVCIIIQHHNYICREARQKREEEWQEEQMLELAIKKDEEKQKQLCEAVKLVQQEQVTLSIFYATVMRCVCLSVCLSVLVSVLAVQFNKEA